MKRLYKFVLPLTFEEARSQFIHYFNFNYLLAFSQSSIKQQLLDRDATLKFLCVFIPVCYQSFIQEDKRLINDMCHVLSSNRNILLDKLLREL